MIHKMTLCHQRPLATGDNALTWQLPNNLVEFGMFDRVEFQITVTEATGGASAWSLSGKLQIGMDNRRGPAFTEAPTWRDFDARDKAAHILGGGDLQYDDNAPPLLFDQTDGTSKIARVVIVSPPNLMRVALTPAFTGGTSPKLSVSANAICHLPK